MHLLAEVSSVLVLVFSALAALFFALFFAVLIIPFHLCVDFVMHGPMMQGSYKVSWLGFTLKKEEIKSPSPEPSGDADTMMLSPEVVHESERNWQSEAVVEAETENKDEAMRKARTGNAHQAGIGKPDNNKSNNEKTDEKKANEAKTNGKKANEVREDGAEGKTEESGALPFNTRTLLDAFPSIVRVCRDLVKSLSFQKLSCRICFGLDDPADTAVMSGYLWAIVSALGLFRANILISPSFAGMMLEGDFVADVRARMIYTLLALINALREREIRKLLREVVRS